MQSANTLEKGGATNTSPVVLAEDVVKMYSRPVKSITAAAAAKTLSLNPVAASDEPGFESKTVVKPKPLFQAPKSDIDELFCDDSEPLALVSEPEVMEPNTFPKPKQVAEPDKLSLYLAKKRRIVFKLSSGTVMMTVIDAVVSPSSIIIVIPNDTDGCVFIPSVGERFSIEIGSTAYSCSAPGLVTSLPELGLTFITLIREEVYNAQP